MNPQQTMSPTQTPTPTTSPVPNQALQYPFWYVTGGSVFSAKKGVANLSTGRLSVTDAKSGQEVYSFNLTPDIKIVPSLGTARIVSLNGQNLGMFNKQSRFYFYNPMFILLSYWFAFTSISKAKDFVANCKQAAGAPQ